MHTVWQRLNALGTFAGTVLAAFCGVVALTGLLHKSDPAVSISLNKIDGLHKEYGNDRAIDASAANLTIQCKPDDSSTVVLFDWHTHASQQEAWVSLNMKADLRSLYNWNTKQLFVSVEVDFATKTHAVNSMMIWAKIIKTQKAANLKMQQLRAIYPFMLTDHGTDLRGQPFNVTLKWNVMPRIGVLTWDERTFTGFQMPEEYVTPAGGRVPR